MEVTQQEINFMVKYSISDVEKARQRLQKIAQRFAKIRAGEPFYTSDVYGDYFLLQFAGEAPTNDGDITIRTIEPGWDGRTNTYRVQYVWLESELRAEGIQLKKASDQ